MRFSPCVLAGALVLSGCATQVTHPLGRTVRRPGTEPEYFQVAEKDAEMDRAVRMARRHLRTFITALQNPSAGQRDFEVKKPFVQGDHVEHIWLSDVQYSGKRFHGRVDNKPQEIKGLKMGTRVSVNPDEISDWLYVDNGKLVGGYTIRVLCTSCNATAKQRMERQGKFTVDNQ